MSTLSGSPVATDHRPHYRSVRSWASGVWLSLALIGLLSPALHAIPLAPVETGIELDAGSIGKLVLEYPEFLNDQQQPAAKIIQKTLGKQEVQLKYEGGLVATATLSEAGVRWHIQSRPAQIKHVSLGMQIPLGFNQGGAWQAGQTTGKFPVQKPAQPHLYQGHAETYTLSNYEGRSLVIQMPPNTFQQLSDNREWNWPIYFWKGFLPLESVGDQFTVGISATGAADGAAARPLVDALGQSNLSTWPGKMATAEELQAEVAADARYYADLHPRAVDAYGGLPGSGKALGLQATGFFHLEKKGERWVLVNPAGNAFFHLGVCVANPNDDYTLVTGRESAYAWIPEERGPYASAFRKGQEGKVISYHLTNQIRKYGKPYDGESYTARMIKRLQGWGFNSMGAFTPLEHGPLARKAASFPTVAHLPINVWEGVKRIPGIHETFDPWDEPTREMVVKNLAQYLPAHASDPLIIGWYIVNEPIYEQIPHIVPTLPGSQYACKRELIQFLKRKYGEDIAAFSQAWGLPAADFAALLEPGLAVTTEPAKQDMIEYASLFLQEYLKLVAQNVRQYAPNHLLIGSRLQPGTISHEWICRAMGPYVDVMSFNYYTYGVDQQLLRRVYEWTGGKPMMLSEFFWSSPEDSGLTGGREVHSQRERGLAYRNYVEQSAALGFVVGIEWFTLVDQSVTGRWFSGFDGERANTGLLSVTDRPWKETLEEMMKTHARIYEVWLGKAAPFAWDDPRFK